MSARFYRPEQRPIPAVGLLDLRLLAIAAGVALVVGLACLLTSCAYHGPYRVTNPPPPAVATPLPPCSEVTPAPGVSCFACADEPGDKERIGLGSAQCAHLVRVTYGAREGTEADR